MNGSFSCPRCAAAIAAGARFCQNCGQALEAGEMPAPAPGQYAPPAGQTPYYVQQQQDYQRQQANSSRTVTRIVIWVLVAVVALPVLIVFAVAVPMLFAARNNAVNEKARNCLRTVVSAEAAYYAQHQVYGSLDDLVNDPMPYLDSRFSTSDLGNGIRITEKPQSGGQTYTCTISTESKTYTANETGQIKEEVNYIE